MKGKLWSIGVEVHRSYGTSKWTAVCRFQDESHCDDEGIEGMVTTKYRNDISFAIDTIIADAKKMGIEFWTVGDEAPLLILKGKHLYYEGDIMNLVQSWQAIVENEAKKIGWRFSYERY